MEEEEEDRLLAEALQLSALEAAMAQASKKASREVLEILDDDDEDEEQGHPPAGARLDGSGGKVSGFQR